MATLTITVDYDAAKVDEDEIKDVLEVAIFSYSAEDEHILSAVTAMSFVGGESGDEVPVTRGAGSAEAATAVTEDETASLAAAPAEPPTEDDPALADPPEDANGGAAVPGTTPADVYVGADGQITATVEPDAQPDSGATA